MSDPQIPTRWTRTTASSGPGRPGSARSERTNLPGCSRMRAFIRISPSPLYSGERAGVRGSSLRTLERRPLTLTLSPEYRGEGTESNRDHRPAERPAEAPEIHRQRPELHRLREREHLFRKAQLFDDPRPAAEQDFVDAGVIRLGGAGDGVVVD